MVDDDLKLFKISKLNSYIMQIIKIKKKYWEKSPIYCKMKIEDYQKKLDRLLLKKKNICIEKLFLR